MTELEKTIHGLERISTNGGLINPDKEVIKRALKLLKEQNRTVIRFKSIWAAKRFMRKIKKGEIIVGVESVKE